MLGENPWCANKYSFMVPWLGTLATAVTGAVAGAAGIGAWAISWGGVLSGLAENATQATSATADSEATADKA